jgi:hypothetical protein
VALKSLRANLSATLKAVSREARVSSDDLHPNVIPVYDVIEVYDFIECDDLLGIRAGARRRAEPRPVPRPMA